MVPTFGYNWLNVGFVGLSILPRIEVALIAGSDVVDI